jgi:AcrR family transcriptional regulator
VGGCAERLEAFTVQQLHLVDQEDDAGAVGEQSAKRRYRRFPVFGNQLYPCPMEQRTGEAVKRGGEDAARRLPPGSHGIPAEVVARNQRERLVAAMAEVCAERGYAETSVWRVAKRAGVSSVTFYKQFSGKQDCLLASHQALLERLLEEVDRASGASESTERAGLALRTALAIFAADPPSARLLTVEILAAGPEGVKRQDAMVEAFAVWLGTDWVRAAGLLALVGKYVVAGEAERLPQLEDELTATLSSQS